MISGLDPRSPRGGPRAPFCGGRAPKSSQFLSNLTSKNIEKLRNFSKNCKNQNFFTFPLQIIYGHDLRNPRGGPRVPFRGGGLKRVVNFCQI